MSDTPNHSYNLPAEGERNWHQPLNANFQDLEVDIELRDAGAPGANGYQPTDGAKYLDTSNGLVYLADGDNWNQAFDLSGGGGGGISSLSGGTGVAPSSIGDGDSLSVVWADAANLGSTGQITDFSEANDLDADGNVTASGGGGISSLSGGTGVAPSSIGDGDSLSVVWADATDLTSGGSVETLTGSLTGGQTLTDITGTNLSIDASGTLNASGGSGGVISSLSGGDGISPGDIGDGDELSVVWGDASSLDARGDISDFGSAASLDARGEINDFGSAASLDARGDISNFGSAASLNSSGDISDFGSAASLDSNGDVDAGRYLTTSGGRVEFVGPAAWENGGDTATNTASGGAATVAGGEDNEALGFDDTVGGGENNTADGGPATVAGGRQNSATDEHAVVSGGANNDSLASGSCIGGGARNEVDGDYATVGGGNNNLITANYATIAGGNPSDFGNEDATRNAVYDRYGTIGGGGNNQAGSDDGTVNAEYATVPGGRNNAASGAYSTASGRNNTASGAYSTASGRNNTASGAYSTAMGRNATASEDGSFVVGDSSSTELTPSLSDEAVFQMPVNTAASFGFTDESIRLDASENGDGNEVFTISSQRDDMIEVVENGNVTVTGDFDVAGNKNFVQSVDTDEGEREVVYTTTEAGEARTETSGVATVEDGRVVIELPDHFDWVTSDDEPLVVQTTPYASEPVRPQVTERSTDRIVVEDFAGAEEYEISYSVKGTRAGHEDKQTVREPTATGRSVTPADDD